MTDSALYGVREDSSIARRLPLWVGLVVGLLLGFGAAWLQPVRYRAEVALYFPGLNSSLFRQLTQTLQADAVESTGDSQSFSSPSVVEAAERVLGSRAALAYSMNQAKVVFTPSPFAPDPVERFRRERLHLESNQASSIRLSVVYYDAEQARLLCQGLLDYYTQFVKSNALTNTARARNRLEAQLKDLDKQLVEIETRLVASSDGGGGLPGGGSTKPDISVLREVWKKRIAERGQGQRVLNELRKIRAANTVGDGPVAAGAADNRPSPQEWTRRWGPVGAPSAGQLSQRLPGNVRKSDLPSRLKWERHYEQLAAVYQAASLQHQFLSIWETLESFDFEILDPISVSRVSDGDRWLFMPLLGGLMGLLLASVGNRILRLL